MHAWLALAGLRHGALSSEKSAGPPLKLSERVTRLTSLSPPSIEQLLSSLGLHPQQGLDPDADNAVAVGTFAYGSLASPMQVSSNPPKAGIHTPRAVVHPTRGCSLS